MTALVGAHIQNQTELV